MFHLGATSYGMLRQAERIVRIMIENEKYDYSGSWKVLTLFIGSNDLCRCCMWWNRWYQPENYLKGVYDFLPHISHCNVFDKNLFLIILHLRRRYDLLKCSFFTAVTNFLMQPGFQ